jgi:hypothetical protein
LTQAAYGGLQSAPASRLRGTYPHLLRRFLRHTDTGSPAVVGPADYKVIEEKPLPQNRNILRDQIIELSRFYSQQKCTFLLRRIEAWYNAHERIVVLLTNHLFIGSMTIAAVYKDRRQIKIFFKTIKQNLKIKNFVRTSPNALMIQIWTALIAILILKYLKYRSTFGWSLSNLIAMLRYNLFTYRVLWEWIHNPMEIPPIVPDMEQLSLKGI